MPCTVFSVLGIGHLSRQGSPFNPLTVSSNTGDIPGGPHSWIPSPQPSKRQSYRGAETPGQELLAAWVIAVDSLPIPHHRSVLSPLWAWAGNVHFENVAFSLYCKAYHRLQIVLPLAYVGLLWGKGGQTEREEERNEREIKIEIETKI